MENKITFDEAKQVLDDYIEELNLWFKENKPLETPTYNQLLSKDVWGTSYQKDLKYFKDISEIKSKLFALKTYFTKMKSEAPAAFYKKHDVVLSYIDDKIKDVDNRLFTVREQLIYYQTVIKVIMNFSFGDY